MKGLLKIFVLQVLLAWCMFTMGLGMYIDVYVWARWFCGISIVIMPGVYKYAIIWVQSED